MPLGEIIYDFFDALKARTKGFASLDYEMSDYRESDLVKVDLLLNGEQVDALSFIAHREKGIQPGRRICEKLKENIPRQLFEVPIQAAIGGKIIARETVKAMRRMCWPVLWRRHHPEKEAAGEAERRQKEDAELWEV